MAYSNKPADQSDKSEVTAAEPNGLSPALTFLFAFACGAMVGNIYYAQALIGLISDDLNLHGGMAGFIVTVTQLGYGAGLLLLVSLADLFENRRLVLLTLGGTALGLAGAAVSGSATTFLISSFAIGFFACGAQVLVPFASHLVPAASRGRTIGNVMAGLLTGIMLARPLANLVASEFGWRAIFWISAAAMLAVLVLLRIALPQRQPQGGMRYGAIIKSMWHLLITTPALQRRAFYQGIIFASFNLFWTGIPLLLSEQFGYSQRQIALFALAGAAGALAAPIAGRLADRGYTRQGTAIAMVTLTLWFLIAGWAGTAISIAALVLCAIFIDSAVQTNQILSQRIIFSLNDAARGRLNAVYMTIVFLLGSSGSAIAAASYFYGGWWATCMTGAIMGLIVLGAFATEKASKSPV
ncbi:putative MFS family arabinose efflux permease [Phyllobacterium ifriqiyense]|uniref:MFS family arabinose efflux permease n=1 Tax=Phyllobacterium ifriqiyense TaxID=314238 RepID=A0ABU0SC36_9HYPH|nr:MFS transporter [Phyllobacterium ifriqiyense]MDQ0997313.1 putative MFS family arabinose efflux permease [Phyllobacterium ifriqiyense]